MGPLGCCTTYTISRVVQPPAVLASSSVAPRIERAAERVSSQWLGNFVSELFEKVAHVGVSLRCHSARRARAQESTGVQARDNTGELIEEVHR